MYIYIYLYCYEELRNDLVGTGWGNFASKGMGFIWFRVYCYPTRQPPWLLSGLMRASPGFDVLLNRLFNRGTLVRPTPITKGPVRVI